MSNIWLSRSKKKYVTGILGQAEIFQNSPDHVHFSQVICVHVQSYLWMATQKVLPNFQTLRSIPAFSPLPTTNQHTQTLLKKDIGRRKRKRADRTLKFRTCWEWLNLQSLLKITLIGRNSRRCFSKLCS